MSRAEDGVTRRSRGFERASGLVASRVRRAGEGRGFAVAKVLTHWAEVAGEEIAALARPVEVSYGREGMGATLTLLASGAAAPLLQMRLPEIRDRVNACYGYAAIARVRITQSAAQGLATGFAETPAGFAPAPPQPVPEPDPAARREAEAAAREVDDPGLRAALECLGRNVFSKS